MPQSPFDSPLGACPSCGQHLNLPVPLSGIVACPRCGKLTEATRFAPLPSNLAKAQSVRHELSHAKTVLAMPSDPPRNRVESETTEGEQQSRILGLCDGIERIVAGKRALVVVIMVLLTGIVGPIVDRAVLSQHPIGTVLATNALLIVLWTLFFSWFGTLRDEEGRYRGWLLGRRAASQWIAFSEGLSELLAPEVGLRRFRLGVYLLSLGCLLVAARGIVVVFAIAFDWSAWSASTGWYLLGAGFACAAIGVVLTFRRNFGGKRAVFDDGRAVVTSFEELPAILDLSVKSRQQLGQADPLRATLTALAKWQSRRVRHYTDEYEYRGALWRLMRRHASHLECRRDVWMGKHRSDQIADLVLGGLVLVVIKRGFASTQAQRAIEQMQGFAKKWPGKPKLLVIFDADRREVLSSAAISTLQSLHAIADTITVVM